MVLRLPLKAPFPILITLFGIVIVSNEHPANANLSMLVTPFGITILYREWHSPNE